MLYAFSTSSFFWTKSFICRLLWSNLPTYERWNRMIKILWLLQMPAPIGMGPSLFHASKNWPPSIDDIGVGFGLVNHARASPPHWMCTISVFLFLFLPILFLTRTTLHYLLIVPLRKIDKLFFPTLVDLVRLSFKVYYCFNLCHVLSTVIAPL